VKLSKFLKPGTDAEAPMLGTDVDDCGDDRAQTENQLAAFRIRIRQGESFRRSRAGGRDLERNRVPGTVFSVFCSLP
jgi:hypothetical protein